MEAAQNSCSWDSAPRYAEVFKVVEFRFFQDYYKNILCAYDYGNKEGVEKQVSQQKGK